MWNVNPTAWTTPVFGPAAKAASFQNLDLSGAIGTSGVYLVKLVVVVTGASSYVSFRPNGNTKDYDIRSYGDRGIYNAYVRNGYAATIDIVTDANGIVEWFATSSSATFSVYLVGWVDAFAHDQSESGAGTSISFPSSSWATTDLSGIVGANDALALIGMDYISGTVSVYRRAIRPADDASNTFAIPLGDRAAAGCVCFSQPSAAEQCTVLTPTDNSGRIEGRTTTFSANYTGYVHGYVTSGWNRVNTDVKTAYTPPTNWTDLDLSAVIGLVSAYVMLKIERSAGGSGTFQQFAVRQKDANNTYEYLLASTEENGGSALGCIDSETATYLTVATDSAGVCQLKANTAAYDVDITVIGYISSFVPPVPPTIDGEEPKDTTAAVSTDITFSTESTTSTVQSDSYDVTITDVLGAHAVIVDGVFQPGYDGTISANGDNGHDIAITTHPAFAPGTVTVDAFMEDADGETLTASWSFTVDVLSDINPDHSLLTLPGLGYYQRSSDDLYVTEAQGKAGVREALMGSDGSTTTEFPSIIRPRGFRFDGGDAITIPDNPDFTPSAGGGVDTPMSWAFVLKQSGYDGLRFHFTKGVLVGSDREWNIYSSDTSIFCRLYDSGGAYIGRSTGYDTFYGEEHVIICTYDGSKTNAGIKIYRNAEKVDANDAGSGTYSGVSALGTGPVVGGFAPYATSGDIILPMIFNTELSADDVSVLTGRMREMYATTPRR